MQSAYATDMWCKRSVIARQGGAYPHKGLELADVGVRLLDANLAQGLQEVAACQDAHLHAAQPLRANPERSQEFELQTTTKPPHCEQPTPQLQVETIGMKVLQSRC